jgi:hypothetical protein
MTDLSETNEVRHEQSQITSTKPFKGNKHFNTCQYLLSSSYFNHSKPIKSYLTTHPPQYKLQMWGTCQINVNTFLPSFTILGKTQFPPYQEILKTFCPINRAAKQW